MTDITTTTAAASSSAAAKRNHSQIKSRSAASYPRKRAVSACLVCRGRKTKCDNQRPQCGFCRQTGAECVYEAEKLATFDAASLAILDKLSKIEALLESPQSPHDPSSNSPQAGSLSSGGGGGISQSHLTPPIQNANIGTPPTYVGRPDVLDIFPMEVSTVIGSRVESVLQWPIFGNQFPSDDILTPVFQNGSEEEDDEDEAWCLPNDPRRAGVDHYPPQSSAPRRRADINDRLLQHPGEVTVLVQRFFRNVHTKNPILDSVLMEGYVYHIEQHGFGWSGSSCLVLLVCALGAISAPYNPNATSSDAMEPPTMYPSAEIGKMYFDAAKRLLGLVIPSNKLIAVQCLFLAGIYYMYTMKQLRAWNLFTAASTSCRGYLHRKVKSKSADHPMAGCGSEPTRNLEQRIYWSCLKSELELCSELDLTSSGINEIDYPHAFPSPPREIASSAAFQSSISSGSFLEQPRSAHHVLEDRPDEKRLEDEKTWFYYLAEIALRKVELQVFDSFHQAAHQSRKPPTLNHNQQQQQQQQQQQSAESTAKSESPYKPLKLEELVEITTEFELQLELWYSCLPQILKFSASPNHPCSDERLQYLRLRYWWIVSRLYRPFLYYLIHRNYPYSSPYPQHQHQHHQNQHQQQTPYYTPPPSKQQEQLLTRCTEFAKKGLQHDIYSILSNVTTHRHHGAWLGLRAVTANVLVIIAAKRSGVFEMPGRWSDAIAVGKEFLTVWEGEAADAKTLREVIEVVEKECLGSG